MISNNNYNPVVLCILDGWGIGDPKDIKDDAIAQACTPSWDFLLQEFPHTELITSGEAVGLPKGQMGNSEVGHMAIGSGRIVFQDLMKINQAINNGELAKHLALIDLIKLHQQNGKAVHLFGLCSDGGVHSHLDHLIFIAQLLAENNIEVKLHLFLDGRDTPPTSAVHYLQQIDQLLAKHPKIKIATICGRFYAMDRDNRWERIKLAYEVIVNAEGNKTNNWQDYLKLQYQQNIYDEFIIPVAVEGYQGIEENDSVIFTNFRSDRIRQLAQSILLPEFSHFQRKNLILTAKIGMTDYSEELNNFLVTLFPAQKIINGLGSVISKSEKKQLRMAETEKYAHVTFFFNGGMEDPYPGEDRILVPSPKVKTYDLQPEMSAFTLTDKLIESIASKKYDLIVINYANGDMVGHSGKLTAAIEAVEVLDNCLAKIYQQIKKTNGALLITADHGNVECMFDQDHHGPHTAHTTNPVPFLLVANNLFQSKVKLESGNLSDIAPTILELMGIKQPKEMTGKSLIRDL